MSASQTMFDRGDSMNTDIQTYFLKTYNKRPNYTQYLSCVIIKKNIQLFLPMKVCDRYEVIQGQRHM